MADNTKDISENPRNMPENSKNIIDELKEFYEKISPIVKLTSLIASAFYSIISFTFAMTYMRDNGFFSYEIFSINFMWIFLLVGISLGISLGILLIVIHGLYVVGIYLRTYKSSKIWNHICIIANAFIMVFAFLKYCHELYNNTIFVKFNLIAFFILSIIVLIICFYQKCKIAKLALFVLIVYIVLFICFIEKFGFKVVLFVSFFLFFEILIIAISYTALDIKRWFATFSAIFIGTSYILFLLIVALYPELLNDIYKKILKSINLASDHVEIYLKDKNESINGELIFDDGKYAYVKFDRTVSNCGDVGDSCIKNIRKKVPSEDVSIITKVKKNTKASVPK